MSTTPNSPPSPAPPSRRGKGKFLLLVLLLAAMVSLALWNAPRIAYYASEEGRALIVEAVRRRGLFGAVLFSLLQTAQVVVFVLPGEFIEVIGGALYGPVGGLLICSFGAAVGTVLVWNLAHFLGREVVQSLLAGERVSQASFLQNRARLEMLIFWLFFIPGTPKDALTYLAPFTNLRLGRFLLLTSVARIPSIISSTLVGSSLIQGRLLTSLLLYGAVGIVALFGLRAWKKMSDDRPSDGASAP